MDTDAIDNVIKSTYNHRIFEKTDFFKDGIPEWLADSFIITEVKHKSGTPGTVEIYTLDELSVVDTRTFIILENKEKHEAVGMVIYS